jgi:hypothetical protein
MNASQSNPIKPTSRTILAVALSVTCSVLYAYAAVYCPGKPGPQCIIVWKCLTEAKCYKYCFQSVGTGWGDCITKDVTERRECEYATIMAGVDVYTTGCTAANACKTNYGVPTLWIRTGLASWDKGPC